MTNEEIIELYEKGVSINVIAKKYYNYKNSTYCRDQFYHTLVSFSKERYYYHYYKALSYVQDIIIKYINGYFEK